MENILALIMVITMCLLTACKDDSNGTNLPCHRNVSWEELQERRAVYKDELKKCTTWEEIQQRKAAFKREFK